MLCGKCGKNQASFFLSSVRFDERARIGLCDGCAEESGIFSALFKFETMLHGYGFGGPGVEGEVDGSLPPVEFAEECGVCGTDLRSFEREFRLGCDHCCHIFGSLLFNFISLLSPGADGHRLKSLYPGKPPAAQGARERAEKLRGEIQRAVDGEDYLEAERKRDELGREEAKLEKVKPAGKTGARAAVKRRMRAATSADVEKLLSEPVMDKAPCGPWLRSHIEIRRNAAMALFPGRQDEGGREGIVAIADKALGADAAATALYDLAGMTAFQRVALEGHLFSRKLQPGSSFAPLGGGRFLLLNDNDHFCFTYTGPEFDAAEALTSARAALRRFEKKIDFAFSPRFGYLTAAPKHLGAGITVTVLMHLPFSLASGRVEMYPARADRAGVRFEPFRGGSMEKHGFFKVGSGVPFNATEEEVVARVFDFAKHLESEEIAVRGSLTEGQSRGLERLAERAVEQVRQAYRMSYQDALRLATFLSMGSALGDRELAGFSLDDVLPGLSSPQIMYEDRRRYTVNECEMRRAEIFASLMTGWAEEKQPG